MPSSLQILPRAKAPFRSVTRKFDQGRCVLSLLNGNFSYIPLSRDFRYGAISGLPRGVERADHPVAQLVHPLRHVDGRHSRGARTVRGRVLVSVVTPRVLFRDTPGCLGPPAHRGGATRAARCARGFAERASMSSGFRPDCSRCSCRGDSHRAGRSRDATPDPTRDCRPSRR